MTLPFKATFVCVSDVHMIHPEDRSWRIFIKFVKDLQEDPPKIFLLNGDIFDMCAGGHPYFQNKFLPVFNALKSLSSLGTRVVYLQGNHEFYIEDLPWGEAVECVNQRQAFFTLGGAASLVATHGDLLSAPKLHEFFRWLTNTRFIKFVTGLFPGELFDRLCLGISRTSRQKSGHYPWTVEEILGRVLRWYEEEGLDSKFLVVGHYHYPFQHRIHTSDGNTPLVMGLDTWWKRPNSLCVSEEEGPFRLFLEENGEGLSYEKVKVVPQQTT